MPMSKPWRCAGCDNLISVPDEALQRPLDTCLVCGNRELYRKKDFPQWLGQGILVAAFLASIPTYYYYQIWWTWALLLGSALLDGLLYLMVGDVIVCYRCDAYHRGFPPCENNKPYELSIAERYRQERLRKEQLK